MERYKQYIGTSLNTNGRTKNFIGSIIRNAEGKEIIEFGSMIRSNTTSYLSTKMGASFAILRRERETIGTEIVQVKTSAGGNDLQWLYNPMLLQDGIRPQFEYTHDMAFENKVYIPNGHSGMSVKFKENKKMTFAFEIEFDSNVFTIFRKERPEDGFFMYSTNDGKSINITLFGIKEQKTFDNPFVPGIKYIILITLDGYIKYANVGNLRNGFKTIHKFENIYANNSINLFNGFNSGIKGKIYKILFSDFSISDSLVLSMFYPLFDTELERFTFIDYNVSSSAIQRTIFSDEIGSITENRTEVLDDYIFSNLENRCKYEGDQITAANLLEKTEDIFLGPAATFIENKTYSENHEISFNSKTSAISENDNKYSQLLEYSGEEKLKGLSLEEKILGKSEISSTLKEQTIDSDFDISSNIENIAIGEMENVDVGFLIAGKSVIEDFFISQAENRTNMEHEISGMIRNMTLENVKLKFKVVNPEKENSFTSLDDKNSFYKIKSGGDLI